MTFQPTEVQAFVRAAPEWLRDLRIDELDLPLKVRNALKNGRIRYVGDLAAARPSDLQDLHNFGPQSAIQLTDALQLAASRPRPPAPDHKSGLIGLTSEGDGAARESAAVTEPSSHVMIPAVQVVNDLPLHKQLEGSLETLDPLDAEVFRRRLGFYGTVERLEDIGRRLGVTRERARQRESRALGRLHDVVLWASAIEPRLQKLLAHRLEPLFLDLLSAEDPWFTGFEDRLIFLGNVVERFADGHLHIWTLKGRYVLSRIDKAGWDELLRASLSALQSHASGSLSRNEVGLIVESMASKAEASELSTDLLAALQPKLHFATQLPTGTEVLVAAGGGLRPALLAILETAPKPLSLLEIQRRLAQVLGERVSANTCRNALRGMRAFLFSRSTYGLRHHFNYSADECRPVVSEIDQLVQQHPADRQWHCSQLIRELKRRHVVLPKRFDAYMLNVALSLYSQLRYLKRLVWASRARLAGQARVRRDIAGLCITALRQAGRPLSNSELRKAVEKVRGLNINFMPQPSDQMARLGRGAWGLIDRDFGLSATERERILDALARFLSNTTETVHVSSLGAVLNGCGVKLPERVTNSMIFGLAQADRRFRVGRGEKIRLALKA